MSCTFSLISQDKVVTEREVDEVLLPTEAGQIGILPHHADLITTLETGEIVTKTGEKEDYYAVFGGVAEITKTTVSVLADRAEAVESIDLAIAEEARKQAEELKQNAQTEAEISFASALLERNLNRITLVKRRRHTQAH